MSEDPAASRAELEEALGYSFRTPALLETALRHASFAHARRAAMKSGKPVLLFQLLGRLDDAFC